MIAMDHSMAGPVEKNTVPGIPYDWPNRQYSRIVESEHTAWHCQRAGRGPHVLLLHGTAASTHTWRDMFPQLSADYDVLAVDLPGHGFSSRLPGGAMSLLAITRGLNAFLDTEEFAPQFVIAHSAGAAIALQLAQMRPDIRAIVGINAALLPFGGAMRALFTPMAHFFASTRLMPRLLARRAADVGAVRRVLEGTGSVLDADGLDYYRRLFQREQHIAAVLEMMASWNLNPLLEQLAIAHPPTLLITGSNDKAVRPSEAQGLARRFSGIDVCRLQGVGHLAHEEDPQAVVEIVRNFLARHAADICEKEG